MKKDKSKKGFWTRIKNYYNNSPWNAAFTLPILVLIICPILILAIITGLESIVDTDGFIFGVLFVFLPYVLVPIWVFAGLIVSKKKLPYILSLIIGFGSIYLLFTITDQFAQLSQTSATKIIHQSTLLEVKEESTYLSDAEIIISKVVKNRKDVNPFDSAKLSVRLSNSNLNDKDVGFVNLSIKGSNIIIKTCIKTPCRKEENRLQANISIEDTESIINADSDDAVELNCKYKAADKTVNLIIDRKNQSVKYDGRNYRILYISGDNIYFRSEHNYSDVVYNYSTNNLKGVFGLSFR